MDFIKGNAGTVQLPGVQMAVWSLPPTGPRPELELSCGATVPQCCLPPLGPRVLPYPGAGVECKLSVPEAVSRAPQASGKVCVCAALPPTPTLLIL